jgi:hypothetical protein
MLALILDSRFKNLKLISSFIDLEYRVAILLREVSNNLVELIDFKLDLEKELNEFESSFERNKLKET